jgi:2-dehydropantoate 2-reductase
MRNGAFLFVYSLSGTIHSALVLVGALMKILVYGAGVLGSLHAARLYEAGHDVLLVARGQRLIAVHEHGVLLAEGDSRTVRSVAVPVVERPTGGYDLILVVVRAHQVDAALEPIAELGGDVLFLLNWAAGPDPLGAVIGAERVLLGFPTMGGTMDGDLVRYRAASPLTRLVPMPIGEPVGRASPRLERVLQLFRSAGFGARAEPRMDAWLETHAAFEVPLGRAVHDAGGPEALAGDREAIRRMIREMRWNLETLPTPTVPRAFSLLRTVPARLLVPVFGRFLRSTAAAPLNTDSPAVSAELDLLGEQLRTRETVRSTRPS